MPCHYNDDVRERIVEKLIEVDKPSTIRKMVQMEKMLCNAGFIIRTNKNIKGDKDEIADILFWHENHRWEEIGMHLAENKRRFNDKLDAVKEIQKLGGIPNPIMQQDLKVFRKKIEDLERKYKAKDITLLDTREDDCLIEVNTTTQPQPAKKKTLPGAFAQAFGEDKPKKSKKSKEPSKKRKPMIYTVTGRGTGKTYATKRLIEGKDKLAKAKKKK